MLEGRNIKPWILRVIEVSPYQPHDQFLQYVNDLLPAGVDMARGQQLPITYKRVVWRFQEEKKGVGWGRGRPIYTMWI